MNDSIAAVRRGEPGAVALTIAGIGALTICGFMFFEHVLGYPPCPLCLEQRQAYYFGVPLAVLLWLGSNYGATSKVLLAGFGVLVVAMLWNAGLGVYHSGVEWKLWQGPTDCSGPLNQLGGKGGLLNQLQSISVVRCDEAAWRLFGISLSGYNVLVSLAEAALAAHGFVAMWRRPPPPKY